MNRDRITDPEVLADLALRNRTLSERADRRSPAGLEKGQDLDGLSPPLAAMYDGAPDPDVEHWPCRGGCGQKIGVTRAGVDEFHRNNQRLARAGENPMVKGEVMWCPECKRRDDEERAARRRPAEQIGMQLGDTNTSKAHEIPSGMRAPRRSKR